MVAIYYKLHTSSGRAKHKAKAELTLTEKHTSVQIVNFMFVFEVNQYLNLQILELANLHSERYFHPFLYCLVSLHTTPHRIIIIIHYRLTLQ